MLFYRPNPILQPDSTCYEKTEIQMLKITQINFYKVGVDNVRELGTRDRAEATTSLLSPLGCRLFPHGLSLPPQSSLTTRRHWLLP